MSRYTDTLFIVPRIFCANCLVVPCHLNTPTANSTHLSRIHSSPVVHVFRNIIWNAIWSSKSPWQLSAYEILLACYIVVNSICLEIFLDVLSHYHLESLDSIRVWLLTIITWSLGIVFLAQTSFQIWAGFPLIKHWLMVPLSLLNLLVIDQGIWFWYTDLEFIISLIIKTSKYSDVSIIWCLCIFLPLIEYRYSHQLRCGSPDPVLDFIRHRTSYSITLWAFRRIYNAFGKLYPLLCQPCSTFELVIITPEVCGICS